MRSFGAVHLLVLVVLVVLALDSRRLHALARTTDRGRRDSVSGPGIPAGANPDQVGLPLRQIQMRTHVDWQDGGLGWAGPEILPVEEPDEPVAGSDVPEAGVPEYGPNPILPVLWKPFPALPAAGETGEWVAGMLLRPDLFHLPQDVFDDSAAAGRRVLDPDGGAHGVFQQEERDDRAGVSVGGARTGDAGSSGT
jgi:hypothetical protein